MAVLILLRHAKAVRDHEAPSDRARGLTDRGREDAAAAMSAIAELGLEPKHALASSALRTQETFAAARARWPDLAASSHDGLYLADAERIWNILAPALSPDGPLLVVGHNPGLQTLAAALADLAHDKSRTARTLSEHFPTAAFAAFEVTQAPLEAAAPRLLAAWRPKD